MAINTTSYSPNGYVTIAGTSYRFKRYSGGGGTSNYITFTGETSEFTLKALSNEWDGTLEWSTDHTNWTTLVGTEAMQSVGKKLYLRGKGNTRFYTSQGIRWRLSAKAGCSGNIQTLLDWENPPTSISTNNCYYYMFNGCTNLTTAPALPATTLAQQCYYNMFSGCTSLTAVPTLPATTLAQACYAYMFYGCTSLTTAPALPATTLADFCYLSMFNGCTSLKISATQTAEYKTPWRIPSSGTISTATSSWNDGMLTGTGGTFTGAPSVNTTYYGAWGTSGGGGDTPTDAWNEVSGGTFYGGTYFLRLEPNMSLANDSTWDTWENTLYSLRGGGNSDGDGFTIAFDGDANYAGFNTLGYTYYFEQSPTAGGMGELIPNMKAVDHMRYVGNLPNNTNYDGKFLIGSYQSAEGGRSSEWQNNIAGPTASVQGTAGSALSCTENAYPGEGDWLLGNVGDTSIYYPYQTEDTDYKYGTCLKQKTIKIPKFSNSSRLYSSQKINSEGDAFKLWKTMAKLAPSKGDIINLPFWGGNDEGGINYACRVLELDGTIAKVVRLTPLTNALSGGNYTTGTFNKGNSGALYENSSLKTAIDEWLGGVNGTATGGEGNLNLHHALVSHDFEQVLYGDTTSSWMVSGTALSSSLQPIDKKIIANQTVRPLTLEDIVEYLGAGDENLTGDNIKTMLNNLDGSRNDYAVLMSSHNNGVLQIDKTSGAIQDGTDDSLIYPVAYVDLNYLFNTPLDLGWEYGERLTAHKYTLNYNAATGSDECSITVDDVENELASTIINVTSPTYTKTINVVATNTGVTTKAIEINEVKYRFNISGASSVRINVVNSDINIRFVDVDEYELGNDTRSFVINFVQTDDYIAANHPEFLQ